MSSESPSIVPFEHGIYAIDTEFAGTRQMDASHLIVDNGEAAFVDVGSNFSVPILLAALARWVYRRWRSRNGVMLGMDFCGFVMLGIHF